MRKYSSKQEPSSRGLAARLVAVGTRWFRYCCEREGLEPLATFLELLERHYASPLRGPFNLEARFEAGFTPQEMAALTAGLTD